MNESFQVIPGRQVLDYAPHSAINQIYGVWIDNFGGGWLNINGTNLWCPPYTRGWKASIFPGTTSLTVKSYDFANGNIIVGATGHNAIVTIWDEPKGDSDGTSFFDEQTVPLRFTQLVGLDTIAAVLLAAPPVGRYRIYEVALMYGFNQVANYVGLGSSIMLLVYPFGFGTAYFAQLEVSPASPKDSQTIQPPGGDAPIGASILYDLLSANKPNVENMRVSVRYAVI